MPRSLLLLLSIEGNSGFKTYLMFLTLFWKAVAGHTSRMVVVVRLRFHVEYVGEISSVFMNANGAPAFLLWQ